MEWFVIPMVLSFDTPIADALEMPTEIMRQAPFYSDLKQKQVPVRGLRAGDRLEWRVRLVRTAAEAPGRFWGVSAFTGKEAVAVAEPLRCASRSRSPPPSGALNSLQRSRKRALSASIAGPAANSTLLEDPRRRPEPKPRRSAPSPPKR